MSGRATTGGSAGRPLPAMDAAVTPFFGRPVVSVDDVGEATSVIVGAGHSAGSAHEGAENGPYFLRALSKAHTWSAERPCVLDVRSGSEVLDGLVDLGDLDLHGLDAAGVIEAVRATVLALPPGVSPCVVGGDHTLTLGVVQALLMRSDEPFWVVQLDQHLDLQVWGAEPTREREPIFNTNVMSHVSDLLGPGRLLQIGVAPHMTVEDAARVAVAEYLAHVGRQVPLGSPELEDLHALDELSGRGRDVYVTLDIDVLERHAMSSTGYPADTGLTTGRLLGVLAAVLRGNRLVGCDLVEFAAPRDSRDPKTLADGGRAVAMLLHLLQALGRTPHDSGGS